MALFFFSRGREVSALSFPRQPVCICLQQQYRRVIRKLYSSSNNTYKYTYLDGCRKPDFSTTNIERSKHPAMRPSIHGNGGISSRCLRSPPRFFVVWCCDWPDPSSVFGEKSPRKIFLSRGVGGGGWGARVCVCVCDGSVLNTHHSVPKYRCLFCC